MAENLKIKRGAHISDTFAAKRYTRSLGGNIAVWLILAAVGLFLVLPLVYAVASALKPYDEIFVFPPKILVNRPTTDNFREFFELCTNLNMPFSRYLFNSVFLTLVITAAHVVFSSMCAYPLAKNNFPGKKTIFKIIEFSLMFVSAVTFLPQYIIISKLHLIDTVWAMILPSLGTTLGVFLMKQFMEQIPTAIIEAARIDGCSEYGVFLKIIMPNVKPAWFTLMIFIFQSTWSNSGQQFIFREDLRTLPIIINQLTSGAGIARVGSSAAGVLFLMIPPIIMFLILQSNVVETMASAAIKE